MLSCLLITFNQALSTELLSHNQTANLNLPEENIQAKLILCIMTNYLLLEAVERTIITMSYWKFLRQPNLQWGGK